MNSNKAMYYKTVLKEYNTITQNLKKTNKETKPFLNYIFFLTALFQILFYTTILQSSQSQLETSRASDFCYYIMFKKKT